MQPLDLRGQKIGRLLIIKRVPNNKWGQTMWLCECVCGRKTTVVGTCLSRQVTKSCGCIVSESVTLRNYVHGQANKIGSYYSWKSMKQRCLYKKNIGYKYYGARGISICERWKNSFECFFKDMGLRPKGMSLDRINNDGNYEPGNCVWATAIQQANNRPQPEGGWVVNFKKQRNEVVV